MGSACKELNNEESSVTKNIFRLLLIMVIGVLTRKVMGGNFG